MFGNLRADLKTYHFDWGRPGLWVMLVYRLGRWRYRLRPAWIRKPVSFLYKFLYFFTRLGTGIELPCEVAVGKNFRIDHHGCIVVSGYARFGDDCVIRQGVTVGLKDENTPAAPWIGDHVSIGAGAKILGDIRIGNHVRIGANAVVLCDVPDHSTAVGIPARIIPHREEAVCVPG